MRASGVRSMEDVGQEIETRWGTTGSLRTVNGDEGGLHVSGLRWCYG